MNAWVQAMGLDALKPLLAAMLLPPVPWLLLVLLGGWQMTRRRWLGWLLLLAGTGLIWASSTSLVADWLGQSLLKTPPALRDPRVLLQQPRPAGDTLIVVLGAGRYAGAEYDRVTLNTLAMERLRYGIWLSRQTGFAVVFTGGLSPGARPPTEGAMAERVAREEFRHPLAWIEERSRDTHENALYTVDMLRERRVGRIVLVTHGLHQPRALGHFRRARDAAGLDFDIVPAPVGINEKGPQRLLSDYYPTPGGITRVRYALREWLGLLAGA